MRYVNPPGWSPPRGYNNGVLAAPGRLLFVAGQIGWDPQARLVSDDLARQFDQALANVVAVVNEAGGDAGHVAKLTIYVVDKDEYVSARADIGRSYRARMGRHYPAMSLVEVKALLEPGARVEIEAVAVVPAPDV